MRRNSFVLFENLSETKSIEGIAADYIDKLKALRLRYVEIKYIDGINVCWKLSQALLKLPKIPTSADLEILDSSFTKITTGTDAVLLITVNLCALIV